ncbi:MAG: HK97 family phage prohead protease, partial [Pseudobutyrivibrio sp.]|nr:HK97 family phage prohead protease [Pseudobutyrivibrio sp.]
MTHPRLLTRRSGAQVRKKGIKMGVVEGYDFCGWATKNDLLCADGRTIRDNAFAEQDGEKVPIVWGHNHNSVKDVLGHAILENVPGKGVRMYGFLNDTDEGRHAKESVKHGDVTKLSIYANRLKQNGGDVLHGVIREVSLVLAGANPGATIDCVVAHGDDFDDAMIVESADFETRKEEAPSEVQHAEEPKEQPKEEESSEMQHAEGDETIEDVFNTLNDKQKEAVYALIGLIQESDGKGEDMKHNVFDNEMENEQRNVLSHAEELEIFEDAKRYGSLKDAVLAHTATDSNGNTVTYGVADLEYLFPDAKALNNEPDMIKRDDEWVSKFKGAA